MAVPVVAALVAAAPAAAWDSKGHSVVEALAYRTLAEGHGGEAPRPEVLRDLINDGALAAPFCFGRETSPPRDCTAGLGENPLLAWPQPRSDRPDAAFRRQFSDPGQCFHYMATLEDAESERLPGSSIPRALATTAAVRCNDLLDDLLRQIVIDGGPGTRESGYGLYELVHSVADSFSGAHTARRPEDDTVEYLRVWQPIERLARLPTERSARIPKDVYHVWNDGRDKAYVAEMVVDGRTCEERTDFPYEVPYECLSRGGDLSRQAVVELLVLVRDLRAAQLTSPRVDAAPERSDAWTAYRKKWFSLAHPCQGAECAARQPVEKTAGGDALIGVAAQHHRSTSSTDVFAWGQLIRTSEALNPFVYALGAQVGYRGVAGGENAGLLGLQFDLLLPIGKRAVLGFSPMIWRTTFGGGGASGPELLTRLFEFSGRLGERTWISVTGPFEMDWIRARGAWTVGVGLGYALGSSKVAGGPVIRHHDDQAERRDETWVPPPAPYGRLTGRRAFFYLASGITTVSTPDVTEERRRYGLGMIGGDVLWDRDRWGGRYEWVPGIALLAGARATSGPFTYLTGVLALNVRWYALGILGLSVTPVRIEGGPRVAGGSDTDLSADIHGTAPNQYYFQAGSRLGLAFNAGIVDLLIEGPTLTWKSSPFGAGEVLSVRIAIRLN